MIYLLPFLVYCLAFWYFQPYRSRYNRWSCTKFANWIRGRKKPYALGWGGWERWEKKSKRRHPIRHWIAEELLDGIQDFLLFPRDVYREIDAYIDNRFIVKTHYLPTRLKKGEWYDFDTRLLHAMFEGLVDYVEIECASWRDGGPRKPRRSPYYGLKHLNWEMGLRKGPDWGYEETDPRYHEPTDQALRANEIAYLYYWWKEKRPNRVDPYSEVGPKRSEDRLAMEQAFTDEDEAMMIRLVKVSGGMWT